MDPEDLQPRKKLTHEVGADLSNFSLVELKELAAALRVEIDRIDAALEAKESDRSAADSVFKL